MVIMVGWARRRHVVELYLANIVLCFLKVLYYLSFGRSMGNLSKKLKSSSIQRGIGQIIIVHADWASEYRRI